jgi:3-phenylpropionate/trans-cinnamate dioxygenase ferredoxin subunit
MTLVRACNKADIAPGKLKEIRVGEQDLVIANVNGSFYALPRWCTHEEGDLSQGSLKGTVLTCPEHGAQFDVTTGRPMLGPDGESADSIQPEKTLKVIAQGDELMVELP